MLRYHVGNMVEETYSIIMCVTWLGIHVVTS